MRWRRKQDVCKIETGGVYSVARKESFGIVKVLAFEKDKDIVYARIYKARSSSRTNNDQPTEENRIADNMLQQLGMDVGVLPVTQLVFAYWKPELLFRQEITDEEKENLAECFGQAQPWDNLWYP